MKFHATTTAAAASTKIKTKTRPTNNTK
jgi:hypothetical protein